MYSGKEKSLHIWLLHGYIVQVQWIGWMDGLPEYNVDPEMRFSDIIVPTMDTVRAHFLLHLLVTNFKPVFTKHMLCLQLCAFLWFCGGGGKCWVFWCTSKYSYMGINSMEKNAEQIGGERREKKNQWLVMCYNGDTGHGTVLWQKRMALDKKGMAKGKENGLQWIYVNSTTTHKWHILYNDIFGIQIECNWLVSLLRLCYISNSVAYSSKDRNFS